jgi:hypothetical protein
MFPGARVQDVVTPLWLLNLLQDITHRLLGPTAVLVDVCPLHATQDVLQPNFEWPNHAYVNPPYNNIAPFIERACEEVAQHGKSAIFLVPARLNALWYLEHIHGRHPVIPIRGEVQFEQRKAKLPLALCVILLGFTSLPAAWSRGYIERPLDVLAQLEPHRKRQQLSHAEAQRRGVPGRLRLPASL